MTDYFDLEQEIMKCWTITSDLHVVAKHINDGSDYTELMIGMAQLYDMKFERMWDAFEQMVKSNQTKWDKDRIDDSSKI